MQKQLFILILILFYPFLNIGCKSHNVDEKETLKTYYAFIPVPHQEKEFYNKTSNKQYHYFLTGIVNYTPKDTLLNKQILILIRGMIAQSYKKGVTVIGEFCKADNEFLLYGNEENGSDNFPGSVVLTSKDWLIRFEYEGKEIKIFSENEKNKFKEDTISIPWRLD